MLKGEIVAKIDNNEDEIIFEMESGNKYKMYHNQDCCEFVRIDEIVNLDYLEGNEIINIVENFDSVESEYGSGTRTTYIKTPTIIKL